MARPRALIVHPPVSVAKDFIDYPYFADLGAVQLAAVVRAQGLADVALLDAYALAGSSFVWRPDGRAHLGAPVDEVLAAARDAAPDLGARDAIVVAFTPFHRPPARDDVLGALLAGLRAQAPDAALVLADAYQSGQHYVEATGEAVLASYPEADAWVKYEAEATVPELLRALIERGERPRGAHHGAEAELDALPAPAWDLVDLAAHDRFRARIVERLGRGAWTFPIDGRTLPVVTSRGCPFSCAHCSSNPGRAPGAPKTQRRYARERLRAHLTALARTHGATRLFVLDELANVNERHWDGLLDALATLDLRFEIPNGLRADYLLPAHFARMRGRVTTVSVSAESGVQRVVTEVVNKRLDLQAIVQAARGAHEAGVPLLVHFIIGMPGETAEEVNGTLAFAADLRERFGAEPAVQFATPLPGTALARGRALPVVHDWGPAFQMHPSQPDALVPPDALRAFKRAFDARMEALRAPPRVALRATHACNNRCGFCAVDTRAQAPDPARAARLREGLAHHRALGSRAVDFGGGEPTLEPELLGLVRHARALGYEDVAVTTNGRLCFYPEFARRLVRSGLTALWFSVHGPDAASHAREVGVAEAFEQATRGIRNCVAEVPAGVELGMAVTVTQGNHAQLDALAQLAWDLGLRRLRVQSLTPFGPATRTLAPDPRAAAEFTTRVIDRWKDRMTVRVSNLPFCFAPGHEAHLEGDAGLFAPRTAFVSDEDADLARYVAACRVRRPACASCPHAVACAGFYELEDAPELPRLVRAEALTRARAS